MQELLNKLYDTTNEIHIACNRISHINNLTDDEAILKRIGAICDRLNATQDLLSELTTDIWEEEEVS